MPVVAPERTLSALLRDGTREEHEQAENEGFVSLLLGGRLDVDAYADLAAQQHAVYTALEQVGETVRQDRRGTGLVFDELRRVPAIERDLAFLRGPAWRDEIRVLPATATYAARLHDVGTRVPEYAAHAYTRYLGDLSGGQIVQRMMQRHYGMGADGLEFYDFPAIPRLKPFKDLYRARLDDLALTPDETATAVAEAQEAFRLNRAVFVELGDAHPAP
ncbi:heme oxygenase (biliverdin-producing) [Isoptericola sp. b408]|uniref:biliverdin-producing heme oxygenase n=1 Tax=Isoptericola sp. b408 TaxID=3064653 RepID=UPI00271265FA|nr:biliverdin-producing heme oxygenase [Isoptericola sp. b408]MDO8149894.1 biliverdin-producing heme oxygenase [Isoptericola sp. b408]